MPLTIEKADMLAAVAMLSKIPIQEGVNTSSMLKLSFSEKGNLLLSATGGLNCVCYLSKQESKFDSFVVPRAPFSIFVDIARSIDADAPFELTLNDPVLTMRHGRRSIRLPMSEPSGNYGCGKSDGFDVMQEPEGLRKKIGTCTNFAVDNDNQIDLYCVYLAPEGVLAADRCSGICVKSDIKYIQLIPLKFARLVTEHEDGKILVAKNIIRFKSEKFVFEQSLPAKNEKTGKDYFPYEKSTELQKIPKNADVFTFEPGVLQEALVRYGSFISFASDDEKILTVRLSSGKQSATLEMRISGSFVRETVKLTEKITSDVEHKFVANYIAKFCSNVDAKESVSIAKMEDSPFWLTCGDTKFYLAKFRESK